MNLSPTLFSVATGSLAPSPPWNYRMLTDPVSAAAFRGLGLKAVRVNAITALQDVFGANLDQAPNWASLDQFVAGFNSALPGCKLVMVLINHGNVNFTDATMRGRVGAGYAKTAAYLKSHGIVVAAWEVVNEPNFDLSPADTAATQVAVKAALVAQGDQTPVGGPTASWAQAEWMAASANSGAEFSDWHVYVKGPGEAVSTDQLFDRALAAARGGSGPKPWLLTEYGIDSWTNPDVQPDPRAQTIEGAVFVALVGISAAQNGVESTFIWRLENNDGSYGVFHTGTWTLNPAGAIIQAANKYLIPGTITPLVGAGPRTAFLSSDGGAAGRSLLAVNYAISGAPVTVPVPPGMGLRYFQNPANAHGASGGGAPIASIALPPMGIAILSTTAVPTFPDDPVGTTVGPGITLRANGHGWRINSSGVVEVDAIPDTTTARVVSLQSVQATGTLVVQTNTAGGQWSKMQPTDPWTPYTAPVPVPPDDTVATKAAAWDALVAALRALWKAVAG